MSKGPGIKVSEWLAPVVWAFPTLVAEPGLPSTSRGLMLPDLRAMHRMASSSEDYRRSVLWRYVRSLALYLLKSEQLG
jgi:hypothetical protein